jgi:hypothetical protein
LQQRNNATTQQRNNEPCHLAMWRDVPCRLGALAPHCSAVPSFPWNQESMMNRHTLLATTILALASWPMAGHTQSWETATGLTAQSEIHRGTLELRHCTPTGDVLSVGTASPGGSNPNTNLLIQRQSPTGAVGFPRFIAEYDSNSRPEQGARAAEYSNGSGFVTVGSLDQTPTDPTSRLVVTRFDCNGVPSGAFPMARSTA